MFGYINHKLESCFDYFKSSFINKFSLTDPNLMTHWIKDIADIYLSDIENLRKMQKLYNSVCFFLDKKIIL